jgi:SAM-dependent methyltransferase
MGVTVPEPARKLLRPIAPPVRRVQAYVGRHLPGRNGAVQQGTSTSDVLPDLDDDAFLDVLYEVVLLRAVDAGGRATHLAAMADGTLRSEIARAVCGSAEATRRLWTHAPMVSLHHSRMQFVASFPKARHILDLGGTSTVGDDGALVQLGYPYPFEELTIVDLPNEDRHDLYVTVPSTITIDTPLGPVRYRYHSMADLSQYADSSFDLVYSGQTFEHVSVEDGHRVLEETRRVLRPDGALCLDTPNRRVTEIQLRGSDADFINPDHEVEYTDAQMRALFAEHGFTVERAHGLNLCPDAASRGALTDEELAARPGLYDDLENCYLLAYVAHPTTG